MQANIDMIDYKLHALYEIRKVSEKKHNFTKYSNENLK
jgi:hypothetical protein